MTLEFVDRLSENTRTTGTGDFALIGQLSGYQPFSTIGDGNTVYYEAVSGNDWERGTGTYAATNNILARTTISASSNSGSKVNFNKPPVVSSNIPAALQEEIGGGGGSPLTVTDGTTSVDNVTEITLSGATVTDEGGGNALVTIAGGGGGSDDIQTAVVTITSAQLLALQETPVTLVDAPGVGKSLILTSVAYEYDYGTTPYTGGSVGDAWYGSNAGISATSQNDMSIIGQAASSIWSFAYSSTDGETQLLTATENQPIVYQASSGSDWTGGDGTLTITVKYYVAGEQGSSGGAPTFTLTASGNIAAGSAVSVNSSGDAVQTWGPAPNIAGVVTLATGAALANINVLTLSETTFVAWIQNGDGSTIMIPGTIDGLSIELGTPKTGTKVYAVLALSGTSFIGVNVENQFTCYCTISGGVISISTGAVSGSGAYTFAEITATKFAVVCGNDGTLYIGNIVADDVVFGTPTTIGSGGINNPFLASVQIDVLSTTSLVVVFGDTANNNYLTAIQGAIGASAVVFSVTPAVVESVFGLASAPGVLSSTSFALGFAAAETGTPGYGIVASVSVGTVDFGDAVMISDLSASYTFTQGQGGTPFPLAVIDDTHVAFGFGFVLPQICLISGTTLTAPDPIPLRNVGAPPSGQAAGITNSYPLVSTLINSVVAIGDAVMVVDNAANVYEVDESSNASPYVEHADLFSYALNPINDTSVLGWFLNWNGDFQARVIAAKTLNVSGPIGITALGATSGNPVTIQNAGVVDIPSASFTPQQQQYSNGDGSLVAANTGHLMGTAISATKLAINIRSP